MTSAGNKATFLSYASQDAEAVRHIAEALRAAGVEVWFDRNDLVGGDAWDAKDEKIRKQACECILPPGRMPVISAHPRARREGTCRTAPPTLIVHLQDGSPIVQPNQTRPRTHRRALFRRSRGTESEDLAAHEAPAAPRRAGALAADEPSEL